MIKIEGEIWKTCPEFPFIDGSTFGRVRTRDREVFNGKGTQFVKGRVLKQCDNGRGYLQVGFGANGKRVHRLIHRIIAETFLPNPDNLPEINHKDNNPANNNVSNLEWCTHEYNMQYKEKYGISAEEATGRPVFAVNLNTLKVLRFESRLEASRELGVNNSGIGKVVKGRYKYTGGYWFTDDDGHAVDIVKKKLHDIGGTGLKL